MCLITEQKEPKVATEDIVCYKVLNPELTSPCQNFKYEFGTLYKEENVKVEEIESLDDFRGPWNKFSFADELDIKYYRYLFGTNDIQFYSVVTGFHCYKTIERKNAVIEKYYSNIITVKCIIPKGSEYYEDATGLICSNQIIIVEKVD